MRTCSMIVPGVLCHPILAQAPAGRSAPPQAPAPPFALPEAQVSRFQGRVDQPPAQPQRVDWPDLLEGMSAPVAASCVRRLPRVPVDLANGELRMREVDLRVPSRGFDFVWARTYTSRSSFDHGHGLLIHHTSSPLKKSFGAMTTSSTPVRHLKASPNLPIRLRFQAPPRSGCCHPGIQSTSSTGCQLRARIDAAASSARSRPAR